jgi:hypothetical protein
LSEQSDWSDRIGGEGGQVVRAKRLVGQNWWGKGSSCPSKAVGRTELVGKGVKLSEQSDWSDRIHRIWVKLYDQKRCRLLIIEK